MQDSSSHALSAWFKFLVFSGFGIAMFMLPMPSEESFSTGISVLTEATDKYLQAQFPSLLLGLVILAVVGIAVARLLKPNWLMRRAWLRDLFIVSPWIALTKVIALAVTICVMFQIGPEAVRSQDIGESMVGLAKTLIAIAITLSFVLPFLTDCGIMEFIGVLLKPLIRPLFHVPGRASVDLIASWLASSNTAVLITANQYVSGYYSKREAATIMTNFSLVSIPFCLVVAETMHLTHRFPLLYLTVTVIGILLAIIGIRLWPLRRIPDSYLHADGPQIREDVPADTHLLHWAVTAALERAAAFRLRTALADGAKMTIGILLDLIPIVIAWGTIGSLLVNCTPIFYWISYPMQLYLSALGVADAAVLAPGTLVGFIDMFIPALITSPSLAEESRFIIAVLSLVQIIYLTEVGSIIIKSNVGLDIWRLLAIFLQRTVIALPLIVLTARFFL